MGKTDLDMDMDIDHMLLRWAQWGKRDMLPGRRSSLEAEIVKMQGMLIRAEGPKPLPVDYEVELVDRAVCAMPGKLRTIIKTHYMERAPAFVKAKICNKSTRVYWDLVNQGRMFACGYIKSALSHDRINQT